MKRLCHGLAILAALPLCLAIIGCDSTHTVIFKTETCIIPTKKYLYRTCSDIDVFVEGETYVIPKNFKTDLASIPRIFWSFIPPQYSAFVAPAILHDYLYHCLNYGDRKLADELFYSALVSQGVSKFTAMTFYIAVRVFGESDYHSDMNICLGEP